MPSRLVPIWFLDRIIEGTLATLQLPLAVHSQPGRIRLSLAVRFPGFRALAWQGDFLYASRGYEVQRARIVGKGRPIQWEHVADFRPPWWRTLTSRSRLAARLCRDGFHALAALPSGELIAAIPKNIVALSSDSQEFRETHRVLRGTRPLHFAVTGKGHIFWGEYFDNPQRGEVYIYGSTDRGTHWDVAYTFAHHTIRHVHNIVYDQWENCLWVLTGDNAPECLIMRASCDFKDVETVFSGKQQARSVALIPTRDALYFSSDTPFEKNHVYSLDRRGNLSTLAELSSSSICGCRVGNAIFFSTMVEPTRANPERDVCIYASSDGRKFTRILNWIKDPWPMHLFQYGNAFFPDGNNTSGLLAVTTVAVKHADCETTLWQVSR